MSSPTLNSRYSKKQYLQIIFIYRKRLRLALTVQSGERNENAPFQILSRRYGKSKSNKMHISMLNF